MDEWGRWVLFKAEKPLWTFKSHVILNSYPRAYKARVYLILNLPKVSVLFDDIALRPRSDCISNCVHGSCAYGNCMCARGFSGPKCDVPTKIVYKLD
jgi:hypothetical protein